MNRDADKLTRTLKVKKGENDWWFEHSLMNWEFEILVDYLNPPRY